MGAKKRRVIHGHNKQGARYDVIVLALVLNFVGSAEQRGVMLAECARLLKPGGLLFLVLPDAAVSNSRVSGGCCCISVGRRNCV